MACLVTLTALFYIVYFSFLLSFASSCHINDPSAHVIFLFCIYLFGVLNHLVVLYINIYGK